MLITLKFFSFFVAENSGRKNSVEPLFSARAEFARSERLVLRIHFLFAELVNCLYYVIRSLNKETYNEQKSNCYKELEHNKSDMYATKSLERVMRNLKIFNVVINESLWCTFAKQCPKITRSRLNSLTNTTFQSDRKKRRKQPNNKACKVLHVWNQKGVN